MGRGQNRTAAVGGSPRGARRTVDAARIASFSTDLDRIEGLLDADDQPTAKDESCLRQIISESRQFASEQTDEQRLAAAKEQAERARETLLRALAPKIDAQVDSTLAEFDGNAPNELRKFLAIRARSAVLRAVDSDDPDQSSLKRVIERALAGQLQLDHRKVAALETTVGSMVPARARRTLSELTDLSHAERDEAWARSLRDLAYNYIRQKRLIAAAQEGKWLQWAYEHTPGRRPSELPLAARAGKASEDARALTMLIHNGFVQQQVVRHTRQFDGEPQESAKEILRQAARLGVDKGIDRYDPAHSGAPLTYLKNWIRAEMNDTIRTEGRLIRIKAKADDLAKKVEQEAKKISSEGRTPTATEIADRLKAPVAKVVEVLPFVTGTPARLDAPVSTHVDSDETVGSVLVADRDEIASLIEEDTSEKLRVAINDIPSPFRRRVVELCYGLTRGEAAPQKDLFAGVYVDGDGKQYSAEPSVLSDYRGRGEQIEPRSQKDLNQGFKNGELVFRPDTPEAMELARVSLEGYDPDVPYIEREITHLTGVPPTSGTVQEAKRRAEEELSHHAALRGMRPQYRGEDELENSLKARQKVRQALVVMGVYDNMLKAERVKARTQHARSSDSKRQVANLRADAQDHGLVDPDTGRLNHERLNEILDGAHLVESPTEARFVRRRRAQQTVGV